MANEKTGDNGLPRNSAGAVPETGAEQGGYKYPDPPDTWRRVKNAPGLGSAELSQTARKKLEELQKVFGKNLARIRKQSGYSQLTLSLEIGMTHNFINELEQGGKGASFLTLAKLAAALQTPVSQFFEPLEKPSPDNYHYPDAIDQMLTDLHETIDRWNRKLTKQEDSEGRKK